MDASASVDDDDIHVDFDFSWYCEDGAGDTCISRTGETLDLSPFVGEAVLVLPAGSLPAGERGKTTSWGPEADLSPQPASEPLRFICWGVSMVVQAAFSRLYQIFYKVYFYRPQRQHPVGG